MFNLVFIEVQKTKTSKQLIAEALFLGLEDIKRTKIEIMWHQPCQRCKYTTSVDIPKKTRYKASHSRRTTSERSESAGESGE